MFNGMKLMQIEVKGDRHRWGFMFYGDPKYIADWRADGLDVVQIENTVPAWVPHWAVGAWCRLQDAFNFKWRR